MHRKENMSGSGVREPSADRNVRSPSFEPPEYRITLDKDGLLQWSPPANSKELALALSYHFPTQESLAKKMQAAMRIYLGAEKKRLQQAEKGNIAIKELTASTSNPLLEDLAAPTYVQILEGDLVNQESGVPTALQKTIPAPGLQQSGISQVVWKADTGEEIQNTSKKRQYTKAERDKVARNRGNVCEDHRQKKQKVCDPYHEHGCRY
jgi:hypothetical protein